MSQQFPAYTVGISGLIGPGWEDEEVQASFRARREKEQSRQAAVYLEMGKTQEDRINAEERERAAALQKRA
jgi:hypothetical protein